MGAFDILNHLRERGVTLTPDPDGRIRIKPMSKVTDAERAEIIANKPALLALLQRQKSALQPVPEIPPSVRVLCGLDDAEINRMGRRVIAIKRAGYSIDDAEHIADALLLRDRTGLDMVACLECDRLLGRRCTARPAQSFDPRDAHELRRCPAYVPTKD